MAGRPAAPKLPKEIDAQIDALAARLNRRSVVGPLAVALETARLLKVVVSAARWKDSAALRSVVLDVSARLTRAQAIELAAPAVARRVLHLLAEEESALRSEAAHDDADLSDHEESAPAFRNAMRPALRQAIDELIDELETASANIAAQALEHIHSNEIIMTIGHSPIVEQFLKEAAKLRTFQVIVAETAPFYTGQEMAASLAAAGIDTTLITDSAIFAVMSRVNKVILGAHAVTANGGLVAISGSLVVASAAKHHSTPVVVCAGLHTLSPIYPYDTGVYSLCVNPNTVSNFDDGRIARDVDMPNPYFDYVAPDLVSLFITNVGSHPPAYVQRVVSESYSEQD